MVSSTASFFFPPFRLELTNERLWGEDKEIPLRRKTFAVLQHLVERNGQLVTKEQLFGAVWPGTYVGEVALTICITELRKALGDDTKKPRFIETVRGRGYRFIAEVQSPTEEKRALRSFSCRGSVCLHASGSISRSVCRSSGA